MSSFREFLTNNLNESVSNSVLDALGGKNFNLAKLINRDYSKFFGKTKVQEVKTNVGRALSFSSEYEDSESKKFLVSVLFDDSIFEKIRVRLVIEIKNSLTSFKDAEILSDAIEYRLIDELKRKFDFRIDDRSVAGTKSEVRFVFEAK